MNINERLTQWARELIEREYKDDVCLLIGHDTLKLPQDADGIAPSFYIPATERAYTLSRTFIIDGIGYDLFPMSWERVEGLAAIDGYNTSCLLDCTILYQKNDEEKKRFLALQERAAGNLKNPAFMFERALDKLRFAMSIYETMLFSESEGEVRNCAGHICDILSISVACINMTYFRHGQTNQFSDLEKMKALPEDFLKRYRAVINARSSDELKSICFDMIKSVRQFVSEHKPDIKPTVPKDYKGLANWYQELCYTMRRVNHFVDTGKAEQAFLWGCGLHHELSIVSEEYTLGEVDLMGAWDASDMQRFRQRTEQLERLVVSAIEQNGVTIKRYADVEEFLSCEG